MHIVVAVLLMLNVDFRQLLQRLLHIAAAAAAAEGIAVVVLLLP